MTKNARAPAGAKVGTWPRGVLLFGGETLLVPAAPAAVHGDGVLVAHLLEIVGGKCGAESAATVQDDFLILVRDGLFDVALDDAFTEVDGAGNVSLAPLIVFADVDQRELLAGIQALLYFSNVGLFDAGLGVVDDGEESGGV